MELRKRSFWLGVALLSAQCFAQQTIAPFKTQQANTVFYVNMGNTTLTTIQKTVTAACAYSTATMVDILPGSSPSDTIAGLTSACTATRIFDQRVSPADNYTCTSGGCTLLPFATGTVSSVSASGTQGVTVSVTNPTTTPALVVGLGAITPTSVSTAAITNTSLTNGDVVVSGTGGVQTNGPAASNIPLLNTNNTFTGGFNSFGSAGDWSTLEANKIGGGTGSAGSTTSWNIGNVTAQGQFGSNALGGAVLLNLQGGGGAPGAISGQNSSGAEQWSITLANGFSGPGVTDSALSSGDVVVAGTGGVLGSGPAIANLGLLNGTQTWTGANTFQGVSVGSLQVNTSITNAVGMQVASGPGCTTSAAVLSLCVSTITIPVTEPDTNYTVVGCTIFLQTANNPFLGNVAEFTTTQFQIAEFASQSTGTTGGTINCLVVHN